MARANRTMNPLHFEDLEPHRFEDLARQLIYDFRQWKSLEAIGRAGGDEGIDIRAVEKMQTYDADEVESTDDISPVKEVAEPQERLWIIQCKREHQIGPKKIRSIVSDNLSELSNKPYGYILVAACNFSKKARDAFREEVLNNGVEEFTLWGKGEVEDQLYLPKNDHLLFAYFGISLQIRRRSLKTAIRTRLSLKKKLTNLLGEIDQRGHKEILIRDPRDEHYPYINSPEEFIKSPYWRYWKFYSHQPPDHLAFIYKEHYAYLNLETKEYDVLSEYDNGVPSYPCVANLKDRWWDPNNLAQKYHDYWWNSIPEDNRAWAIELRIIHYDHILAVDEIGDYDNQGPHLLVEYGSNGNPFESNRGALILESTKIPGPHPIEQREVKRISFFPSKIP